VNAEVRDQFIKQARECLKNGQYFEASEFAQQAVETDPNSGDAYMLLGAALSNSDVPDEAADALTAAIRINPASAKARYNLAFIATDGKTKRMNPQSTLLVSTIGMRLRANCCGRSKPNAVRRSRRCFVLARRSFLQAQSPSPIRGLCPLGLQAITTFQQSAQTVIGLR
jgi:tetratricopeptide (TPR) repeat protein